MTCLSDRLPPELEVTQSDDLSKARRIELNIESVSILRQPDITPQASVFGQFDLTSIFAGPFEAGSGANVMTVRDDRGCIRAQPHALDHVGLRHRSFAWRDSALGRGNLQNLERPAGSARSIRSG